MPYVVKDNFGGPSNTCIHYHDCIWASRPGDATASTRWLGPFVTYVEAVAEATARGRRRAPRFCAYCARR